MKPAITFQINKKTRGYVKKDGAKWLFCTGKPSDVSCLSWSYNLIENAILKGHDYMRNYAEPFGGKYTMNETRRAKKC